MRNAIRQWAFDCAWDDLSERQIDDLELLVIGVLNAAPVSAEPCKECDAKQAKIDSLMLEYCPDEITDEQMTEWSANQKPVSECRHCGWLCMPNDSHSKKWYPMQEPVKQEPVVVGYLDVGEGGYLDIGTDLTDDQIRERLSVGKHNLYAAPVDAKAIRAETLEEAAKLCEAKQSYNAMYANTEFAAAIRGLK